MTSDYRRLVLWDIDGTLVSAGSIARVAFDLAVARVLGCAPPEGHGVRMSGKTDPQIALEILGKMAIEESEARRHLPAILRALERELEDAVHEMRDHGRVHPGVPQLLARLHTRPEVLQSVLTGNLAANGRLKVAVFGLDRWLDLDVAATATDHHDRTKLVPIALQKVEQRFGTRLSPDRVWVVGDTPRDLACARAGGARCLLVGTGRIALERLQAAGADAVVPDLSDVDAVERLLVGDAQPSTPAASGGGSL